MKIGCTMPFSGNFGFYGLALRPYVEAMVAMLNEAGGVPVGNDAYKIEMLFPDDGADPKRGPICAQQLIDAGAVANIGNFTQYQPFTFALNQAGIISMSNMSNSIDLALDKYFIATTGYTGTFCSYLAAKIYNSKKVAIYCYDWLGPDYEKTMGLMKSGHGGGYPTDFSTGKVDLQLAIQVSGNQDFSGTLSKFHDEGVDTIFCEFGPGDYALAIKQAADQGYDFNWYTAGSMTDLKEFISIGGKDNVQNAMANCPVPWLFKEIAVLPELQDMAKKITDGMEGPTGLPWNQQYLGAFQYGCGHLQILLDLMKQAGSIDPDAIMEKAIGGTVEAFTGKLSMGGQNFWNVGDRPVIMGTNIMFIKVAGDVYEYAGEIAQPAEFA